MSPSATQTSATRRVTIPHGWALTGSAAMFATLYLAAGALTPLLVVYREQWHFPPTLLTLAFAAYAIGFLAALLTLGSLSDFVGRRPVLVGALVIQLTSIVMFLIAPDIGWVVAARIVQGVASGAATAAFTAYLVELSPVSRKTLGTILGSVGLTGGLAIGSLVTGITIQFTTGASTIIFVALATLTALGAVLVSFSPETVTRAPGALRSLVPRVAVPPAARKEFAAAAPVIAAVWMLAGLSGGIAPSMVRSVFHLDSGLLNGLAGFIAPATSVFAGFAFARVGARPGITIGIYATIVGATGIIGGVFTSSIAIMFVGLAIAGVGFGASFTASLRLIFPLAAAHQRAAIVAGIYLVSYVAFGVPIIIAGQLAEAIGLVPSVFWYSAATVLLALISLWAQLLLRHRGRSNASTPHTPELVEV